MKPRREESNLVLGQDVHSDVSVRHPTGGGARDPGVLLNETAHQLHGRPLADFDQNRTYNTYDGQNPASGLDWYAIELPERAVLNCIEMTMGLPYRDGGWWTSVWVEVWIDGGWQRVENLIVTPPYHFDDEGQERRPYETYVLTFDDIAVPAVRVIGRAGGIAQFTSLARLALYHRDLTRWNPTDVPPTPVPDVFQFIQPETVWDLSENLTKLTGLTLFVPLLEYYLDAQRYKQLWRRYAGNYFGEPELWFLLGESVGWDVWNQGLDETAHEDLVTLNEPHVRRRFHNTLAQAVAPIVVDGQVLCELRSRSVILSDAFDWEWHQRYAQELDLTWPEYLAAVKRTPHLTLEQLQAAAALTGLIANTIANLMHRNVHLERELAGVRGLITQRAQQRKELVRQSIDFMEENLEAPVGVAEVARAVGLSPSRFSILFTEQIGRNPRDFLIDLRLERARDYLTNTHMSVTEVCDVLGYDPSYFTRLFKRRHGCTPGNYLRRMRSH